jgi:hypothetical protein
MVDKFTSETFWAMSRNGARVVFPDRISYQRFIRDFNEKAAPVWREFYPEGLKETTSFSSHGLSMFIADKPIKVTPAHFLASREARENFVWVPKFKCGEWVIANDRHKYADGKPIIGRILAILTNGSRCYCVSKFQIPEIDLDLYLMDEDSR